MKSNYPLLKYTRGWSSYAFQGKPFVLSGIEGKSQKINAYHFFHPLKVTPKRTSQRARLLKLPEIDGVKTESYHSPSQHNIMKMSWTSLKNSLLLGCQGKLMHFIECSFSF